MHQFPPLIFSKQGHFFSVFTVVRLHENRSQVFTVLDKMIFGNHVTGRNQCHALGVVPEFASLSRHQRRPADSHDDLII
jgi:hypothetical protein